MKKYERLFSREELKVFDKRLDEAEIIYCFLAALCVFGLFVAVVYMIVATLIF